MSNCTANHLLRLIIYSYRHLHTINTWDKRKMVTFEIWHNFQGLTVAMLLLRSGNWIYCFIVLFREVAGKRVAPMCSHRLSIICSLLCCCFSLESIFEDAARCYLLSFIVIPCSGCLGFRSENIWFGRQLRADWHTVSSGAGWMETLGERISELITLLFIKAL